MGTLVSINVGLPRDVEWQAKVVRAAIWKRPVEGKVIARRLNIDGDSQGVTLRVMAASIAPGWCINGAPHGLTVTHADQVNTDLLAFFRS